MHRPHAETNDEPCQLVILTQVSPENIRSMGKFPVIFDRLGIQPAYWAWVRGPRDHRAVQFPNVRALSTLPGRTTAGRIVGYLWWIVRVFFAVLAADRRNVFLCERLECAFPVALASVFRPCRLFFRNSDNLYLSYRWPRWIRAILLGVERFTVRRATIHQVPSASRWNAADANRRIVQNWPTRALCDEARRLADRDTPQHGRPFTVYVNGWLTETRGLKMIVEAAERLQDAPLMFLVCGNTNGHSAERLIALPNVTYLGVLSPGESLAKYDRSDVVLTFYDPAIEINRLAEPNKWFDCVVTQTPFITNDGVLTAEPFLKANTCLSIPYDSAAALDQVLRRLLAEPALLADMKRNLQSLPLSYWDDEMENVLREFLLLPPRIAAMPTQRQAA